MATDSNQKETSMSVEAWESLDEHETTITQLFEEYVEKIALESGSIKNDAVVIEQEHVEKAGRYFEQLIKDAIKTGKSVDAPSPLEEVTRESYTIKPENRLTLVDLQNKQEDLLRLLESKKAYTPQYERVFFSDVTTGAVDHSKMADQRKLELDLLQVGLLQLSLASPEIKIIRDSFDEWSINYELLGFATEDIKSVNIRSKEKVDTYFEITTLILNKCFMDGELDAGRFQSLTKEFLQSLSRIKSMILDRGITIHPKEKPQDSLDG